MLFSLVLTPFLSSVATGHHFGGSKMPRFGVGKPPGATWGPTIYPRDPPRAPPRPTLEPPKRPKIVPGTPRSAQGPFQIHKVDMLKTLEICVLDPPGSQKSGLGRFFDAPRPSLKPSRVSIPITRVAPGRPKGLPGTPRDPPGSSRTPSGAPRGGVRDFRLRRSS